MQTSTRQNRQSSLTHAQNRPASLCFKVAREAYGGGLILSRWSAAHMGRWTQSQRQFAIGSLVKRAEDGHVGEGIAAAFALDGVHSLSPVAATLPKPAATQRTSLRMGLPSKGRMAEDTMLLMKVPGQALCTGKEFPTAGRRTR